MIVQTLPSILVFTSPLTRHAILFEKQQQHHHTKCRDQRFLLQRQTLQNKSSRSRKMYTKYSLYEEDGGV